MISSIALKATSLMAATIAIVPFTFAGSASAAIITYSLTGDTSALSVFNGNNGNPYTIDTINLTNTDTGLNLLSGFTLNVGDTISGTVTLSSPFTMPASTTNGEITINLVGTGDASNIYYPESLTYYLNNVQVSPPSGLGPFGGSGGTIVFGETALSQATQSFTFDKIVFSGTVTEILNDSFQSISSANVTSASPELETITYPVPEPATAWLVLSGLGALGAGAFLGWRRNHHASLTSDLN